MINRILTGLMLSFFSLHLQAAPVYTVDSSVTLTYNGSPVATATDSDGAPVNLSETYNNLPGDVSNYLSGSASLTQSAPVGSSVLTGSLSSGAKLIGVDIFSDDTASSTAIVDLGIYLDTAYVFDFNLYFPISSAWQNTNGSQSLSLSLFNTDTNSFVFTPITNTSGYGNYENDELKPRTLDAGNYQLLIGLTSSIDTYAFIYEGIGSVDFDFTLTPTAVPVPAAAWLFGSGLLGLVGVARRKAA